MGIKMGHMMSWWKRVIKNMYKLLYSTLTEMCECVCWAIKHCTVAVPSLIIIIIIIMFYRLLNNSVMKQTN